MSKTTKKRKPRKQPAKGVGDIVEEVLEKTGAARGRYANIKIENTGVGGS